MEQEEGRANEYPLQKTHPSFRNLVGIPYVWNSQTSTTNQTFVYTISQASQRRKAQEHERQMVELRGAGLRQRARTVALQQEVAEAKARLAATNLR